MRSVIFILLMTVALGAFAQMETKEVSGQKTEQFVKQHEIEYLRSCLAQYHRERRRAYHFAAFGMGLSAMGFTMNQEGQKVFFVIGGALGLYSTYTFLNAERWIKSASIKPMEGVAGVTLTMKL